MNKEEYSKLLKMPEWKAKSLEILKRDNNKCRKCKSKNRLHVHHKFYIQGNMTWQVPNRYLITLCNVCHDKEHENRPIQTFIKAKRLTKEEKIEHNKKYAKSQSKSYVTKSFNKLSKADKDLQKLYDKIRNKK